MAESLIVEAAAVGVAVAAAGIALWSGYLTRKHNRLSVRPRLRISHRFRGSTDYYGVRLINAGLGPAIVDGFSLSLDGIRIENTHASWKGMFDAVGLDSTRWHITRIGQGTVIRPNEELWLFRIDSMPAPANVVVQALSRANLEIRYSSLYMESQPIMKEALARVDMLIEAEDGNLNSPYGEE